MLRSKGLVGGFKVGNAMVCSRLASTSATTSSSMPIDLMPMKLDSNGSRDLYAVFRIHNIPFIVTKGDKVVLPYKLKKVEVGDLLRLNNVTTIGSPELKFEEPNGIPEHVYEMNASVEEITREPYYEVYRKKQRCRRLKTFPVENFQTILRINELKLK